MEENSEGTFIVKVSSGGYHAGNKAKITINNVPVTVEHNKNRHFRGMHIVIIDPKKIKVIFSKVFDTYYHSRTFDEFLKENTVISENFIVIAAAQDDAASKLSFTVEKWFISMGSK